MDEYEDRAPQGLVQIGDLARRLGVQVDTLRAWERRYGLLQPERSAGGFRLYSQDDEAVVRAMMSEIDRGFPPAQAAKLALAQRAAQGSRNGRQPVGAGFVGVGVVGAAFSAPDQSNLEAISAELLRVLVAFDGVRAHEILDTLFAEFTLNAAMRDVLLPCLHRLGDGWAEGDVTVAQEHFASQLIRDRLLGLARDWDQGRGPRALLSCPADERHDIGLICFGLVLARSGWRITFLGPDTPITALAEAVEELAPDLIVLTANVEERFLSIIKPLRSLANGRELALAGDGATAGVARSARATRLVDGPVAAALKIASRETGPPS